MTDPIDNPSAAERPLQYEPDPAPPAPVPPSPHDDEAAPEPPKILVEHAVPEARAGGAPPWVRVPAGMLFPKHRVAVFIKFPSKWTFAPMQGQPLPVETPLDIAEAGAGGLWRQCIVWPLNGGDSKLARGRAMQDPNLFAQELTKQMIRSVDGEPVDWSGLPTAGNIDLFWEQLGGPCQNLLNRIWSQLHVLQKGQLTRFFENYIAVRA